LRNYNRNVRIEPFGCILRTLTDPPGGSSRPLLAAPGEHSIAVQLVGDRLKSLAKRSFPQNQIDNAAFRIINAERLWTFTAAVSLANSIAATSQPADERSLVELRNGTKDLPDQIR